MYRASMSEPPNVNFLIASWPSLGAFARDAGVSYGAAKQMRRRGSIPVDYWRALIESDQGRELGLTSDILVSLHTRVISSSSEAPEAA